MRLLTFLALLAAVCCCGCLHSYMNVASEPAGARVFVDYEDKGQTPAKVEFLWYGKHKIQLFKEGYQRVDEIVDVRCPPHLYIPLDLIFTVIPYPFEDNHNYSFVLDPVSMEGPKPSGN